VSTKKQPHLETATFTKIVGGGQTLGEAADGRKLFAWGVLPGETAEVLITKKKSKLLEGVAQKIITPAAERTEPKDPESYLSTSPWQIMTIEAEEQWKKQLVRDAFLLNDIELAESDYITDGKVFGYRNKVEFSWWWDTDTDQLDLAFFRRGTHGKIPVEGTSLARPEINTAALRLRDLFRAKNIPARELKTLMIRCDQKGRINAQVFVKNQKFRGATEREADTLSFNGLQIIYSNPKSPASVVTRVLRSYGESYLSDTLHGIEFQYATDGFFQVNLPVYEQALDRIKKWVMDTTPVLDFYSGVGTIGLTVGASSVTLVEQNEVCINEMQRNVKRIGSNARIIHASAEKALEFITGEETVIVDPPRAGLHDDVTARLNDVLPPRIIYLSCNPATQARDIAKLLPHYKIVDAATFNFFPRTPHIEQLIVLDRS